ncbi:unnamed protein product [Lymnaea stagnalis]|uniref:Apple domain-containing protein n=1 Tax=Lymnaea stagnalis TaxID=6523 RepID=A0AAV2HBN6_LYMST
MVDTLGIHVFQQIVLTNRGDVSATRLKSFRIDVFTTDPRKMPGFPLILGQLCMNRTDPVGIGTFTWNCTGPVIGRYVRLIKYDSDYLNFCELEAMVSDMISTEDTKYAGQMNKRLTQTAMIVSADGQSPASCAMMCITRRYTDYCSAFNWLSSSNRCELFSVDPRNLTLSSRLVATQGMEFFLEKN